MRHLLERKIMNYKIIADSCCDMTPELKKMLNISIIPLTLTLGETSYTDDDTLNLPDFMRAMKDCTERIGSAAPSPMLYKKAFEESDSSFAVTLSSRLSGSYNSAVLGRTLAMEEKSTTDITIFDSKSASAGEILLVLKIYKLIKAGLQKSKIVTAIEDCIRNMKTYFVLDNIDNLLKNGRLHKLTGKLISTLNIKPLMGSDGDGNIALFSHARNATQVLNKLVATIEKSGKNTTGESVVITHCNNPGLADKVANEIEKRYRFDKLVVVPTGGLSSVYANDKGIIMAF